MLKRITLLLAMLMAVGSFTITPVFAQEEDKSGSDSSETSGEAQPAEGEKEPECD